MAEFSFRTAAQLGACVYGGPKWTVSTVYEGMLKEEMDSAAGRYSEVPYRPTLIDAAYAGLMTESSGSPLVIPALNRDGDCLSDLVLALFGSIAGAESVLLALDDEMRPAGCHGGGSPRHGALTEGEGRRQSDGDAARMRSRVRSCGQEGDPEVARMSAAIRRATLGAAADGIRTFDLGGEASTSEVVDEVVARVRAER